MRLASSRVAVLLLALLALFGLWQILSGNATPAEDAAPASRPPAISRLTRHLSRQAPGAARAPRDIPLGANWRSGDGAAPIVEEDAISLEAGPRAPALWCDVDIVAAHYTEASVTMKVDAGRRAHLTWQSDLEAAMSANPGVSVPILADGAFHTYVFPLGALRSPTWAGRIQRVHFSPSDTTANATIHALRFVYVPPDGPARATLGYETHEVVVGTQAPWPVTVPPNAVFEVWLGMDERAWRVCNTDGVRFTVTVDAASVQRTVLVDRVLNPCRVLEDRKWVPVQVELVAYEGEEVNLTLAVDGLGTAAGDYAYWGNPMVFSANAEDGGTPVVLISCDTLRADRVSSYGYPKETMPHLDAWTKEAVVFENCITPETWTPTAHISMLTGLYPKHHGVSPNSNLAEGVPTLAEVLAGHDYLTAGYTGHSWWLLPWRGFSHGFDLYDTPASFRDVFETHARAEKWIAAHAASPVFLFLHNYDIHSKADGQKYTRIYDTGDPRFRAFSAAFQPTERLASPEPNTPAFTKFLMAHNQGNVVITDPERAYLSACYDDCIQYVDAALDQFFAMLKRQHLYDRALIIVTSDHGEEFGEHGRYLHTHVYEECCRVPLLIKFPHGRFAGRRIRDLVELIDLYPTILDVLDVPIQSPVDGQSLLEVLENGAGPARFAFVQRHAFQAVRSKDRKLIRSMKTGASELYDLAADPAEAANLIDTASEELADLRASLGRFFAPSIGGWHLVFQNDGTPWKCNIAVTTDDRITRATLRRADRIESEDLKSDGHEVAGTIQLAPAITREELLIKTASSKARVYVSVTSDSAFSVHKGKTVRAPAKVYRAVLDPTDTTYPHAPTAGSGQKPVPTLSLWYGESEAGGTPAKDLPEDGLEQLKALGYL